LEDENMNKFIIKNIKGMQVFTLVWFGQFISIMGTAMTRFALMVWAYDQVGKATTTALLGFSSIVPYILLSPFAGAVVDRFDRKKIMILSDLGSGLMTVSIFILLSSGKLQVWHLYLAEALTGTFEAFQLPAYSSAITMLIPKDNYSRASGMRSFSNYTSQVLAPILGGFLVVQIGIRGVMTIDIITFLVAVGTLIMVIIPNPIMHRENKIHKSSILEDMKIGYRYLRERRGLIKHMMMYVGINFLASLTYFGILPAMILARSGSNRMILASVQSALGIGGVLGSIVVSAWKGPKKKMNTIELSGASSFLLGDLFLAIGRTPYVWITAAFFSSLFLPFLIGANTSLWQSKVEPGIQGRVFSIRDMLQMALMPIGYVLGGILADYVFEPAMAAGGSLNSALSWLLGSGKGSGMALMFVFTGIFGTLICMSGFISKSLRNLEKDIPDHEIEIAG
jgi:MFS family permease